MLAKRTTLRSFPRGPTRTLSRVPRRWWLFQIDPRFLGIAYIRHVTVALRTYIQLDEEVVDDLRRAA